MSDTIVLKLVVDGQEALRTFSDVESAGKAVASTIDDIHNKSQTMLPGAEEHIDELNQSTKRSFSRISEIDKEMGKSTTTEYSKSLLSKERSMLLRGIEATISDLNEFQELSQKIGTVFNGKGSHKSLGALTAAMPQLLSFATAFANYSKNMDALMSDQQIAAGIKATMGAQEILRGLGLKNGSSAEKDFLKYVTHLGASQTQRLDYVSRIAGDSEYSKHMFDSFNDMLPKAFRALNRRKTPAPVAASDYAQAITDAEQHALIDIIKSNPYFMQAAESAGFAKRENGELQILEKISRGQINQSAGSLFRMLVSSAKGMPMYGVTDVNNPDSWEKIARKSNKQFIGTMNAARYMQDMQQAGLFKWLKPGDVDTSRAPSYIGGSPTFKNIGQ